MLTHTFCHIAGIGARTEREMWNSGVRSWRDFSDRAARWMSPWRRGQIQRCLDESTEHLESGNGRWFADLLPSSEHWRLFREFRSSAAYLDIETNGLGGPEGYVTTVAIYDGVNVRHYVRDYNLRDFRDDIRQYKLIVTYNGKCFDLPFIEAYLGVRIGAPHIDLRYILGSLGIKGGLKLCEQKLGINRGDLDGLDGYSAVLLWRDYLRNGNEKALETLLAYNVQDTINLERLMVFAWNMKVRATPFHSECEMPLPEPPPPLFKPHRPTVDRLSRACRSKPWYLR